MIRTSGGAAAAAAAELAAGAGGGSTAGEGAVTAADAELAGKVDGVGCSPWCRLVAGASLDFCWSGGHGGCVLGFFKSGSGGGCVEGAECVSIPPRVQASCLRFSAASAVRVVACEEEPCSGSS